MNNSVQEEEEAGFDFKLFPNPAFETVTVKLGADIDISLEIINTQGLIVRKIAAIQQLETIDISSLMSGTYVVRLVNNDIVAVKKLIVE